MEFLGGKSRPWKWAGGHGRKVLSLFSFFSSQRSLEVQVTLVVLLLHVKSGIFYFLYSKYLVLIIRDELLMSWNCISMMWEYFWSFFFGTLTKLLIRQHIWSHHVTVVQRPSIISFTNSVTFRSARKQSIPLKIGQKFPNGFFRTFLTCISL